MFDVVKVGVKPLCECVRGLAYILFIAGAACDAVNQIELWQVTLYLVVNMRPVTVHLKDSVVLRIGRFCIFCFGKFWGDLRTPSVEMEGLSGFVGGCLKSNTVRVVDVLLKKDKMEVCVVASVNLMASRSVKL